VGSRFDVSESVVAAGHEEERISLVVAHEEVRGQAEVEDELTLGWGEGGVPEPASEDVLYVEWVEVEIRPGAVEGQRVPVDIDEVSGGLGARVRDKRADLQEAARSLAITVSGLAVAYPHERHREPHERR